MLSKAQIKNFKSIRDLEIEFDDLTVLVGENNSGKSAAIEALLYYKEAAQANALSYNDIADVDYVGYDFSETGQLLHRNESGQAEHLWIDPVFDVSDLTESERLLTILQGEGYGPEGVGTGLDTHKRGGRSRGDVKTRRQ
jgi:predicted ATP-dependent endonuclease of OLD family